MTYETCCVNSTAELIDGMTSKAVEVTYATFRRNVEDLDEWAAEMGYDIGHQRGGLRLKNDWHVSYHKSTYDGRPCYYLVHSHIEHIFTDANHR